ncbi:MAG: hypothetical protein DRI86_02430 [Bacteroidetes bacterium]|nr:MAG: hypothetical protein DRI86_02430 [Bacteroidota bacterium]
MKYKTKSLWNFFIRNFGQGLLFVVPIAATFLVLYYLFQELDAIFPFQLPGLGIVIIIVGVTTIGFIGSKLVTSPIFGFFNKLINKTPIIKIIYSSVKDLLSAFVGNKKKFTKPVLVKLVRDSEASQIGFLTQDDLTNIGIGAGMVSVYVPFSYSIMGNLYVVPSHNVKALDISPTDAMKFIVSGGVTNVSERAELIDDNKNTLKDNN